MHLYERIFFWACKVVLIFVPTILSYLGIIFNDGKKRTFLELIGDGQICFLVFSMAAASMTNTLTLSRKRPLEFFEVSSVFILFLASLFSTAFYYFFNSVFMERSDDDIYNKNRVYYRNWGIFIILGIVTVLYFIIENFYYQ